MEIPSTALVTVVSGKAYERYAHEMLESARAFFHPTPSIELLLLHGKPGWPAATMYRYHVLLDNMPEVDYVFMIDADMLFVDHVAEEALPKTWVVATQHPGYVGRTDLPFESRLNSACYVAVGGKYFCGGFVGGTREGMVALARNIKNLVDTDRVRSIVPVWHDESALNKMLHLYPPRLVLDPGYCYPDNDSYYKTIWPDVYRKRIVAIDKTEEERGARDR